MHEKGFFFFNRNYKVLANISLAFYLQIPIYFRTMDFKLAFDDS